MVWTLSYMSAIGWILRLLAKVPVFVCEKEAFMD